MRFAGVCAAVLAAALFGTANASAAPTPEFDVVPFSTALNRVADTELDFFFPVTSAAPARISIAVPAGYAVQIAQPGTTVASVDADVQVAGVTKQVVGNVVADDPARYASNTCAPGTHAAVWTMFLTVGGQPYSVPLFVDGAAGRGYTIEACLLSPEVPTTAGGAPGGAWITYLALDFEETFRNPPNSDYHRWSALVTPFASGTAAPDATSLYELRSIVPLPEQLTIKTRYEAKAKSYLITGTLMTVGRPESGIVVDVYGAQSLLGRFTKIGSAKTTKQGTYTLRKKLAKPMWLTAYVDVYINTCDTRVPSPAPTGCILQSYSPVFGDLTHAGQPKSTTKKR